MAHDAQYKDDDSGQFDNLRVVRFDYPAAGDMYFNRYTHHVETADHTLTEKFLIVTREG